MISLHGELQIILVLSLGGWDVANGLKESLMVEPGHPFEGGEFQGFHGFPGRPAMNQFGLVQTVDGFGQGVVVAATLEKLKKVVDGVNSTSSSRKILLQRLGGQDDLSLPVPGLNCREAGKLRKAKLAALLGKALGPEEDGDSVLPALEAVRCLTSAQVDAGYLNPLLLRWFERFYTQPGFPDRFRRAVAHLDRIRYRPAE